MPFFQKSGSTLNVSRVNSNYLNPGLQLVGFRNMSAVTTATITTFDPRATTAFSSENLSYRLVIQELTCATGAATVLLKLNVGGVATTDAEYYYGGISLSDAAATTLRNANGAATGMRVGSAALTGAVTLCATIDIHNPFAAGATGFQVEAREAAGTFSGGGIYKTSIAADGLTLLNNNGYAMTGKMMLYAWRTA